MYYFPVVPSRPSSIARTAAWVRSETWSLARMCSTWILTVPTLIVSCWAISGLVFPCASRHSTSYSRSESCFGSSSSREDVSPSRCPSKRTTTSLFKSDSLRRTRRMEVISSGCVISLSTKPAAPGQTIHLWHAYVDQGEIRLQAAAERQRLATICRQSYHLQSSLTGEHSTQTCPDKLIVISDHQPCWSRLSPR